LKTVPEKIAPMTTPALPPVDLSPEMLAAAAESKAWPFEEADKLVKRFEAKGYPETVIFETGYGPSGLPHIGTFGEVARTSMVCHAFRVLTEDRVATRILCFSDDMDGLRKVPDNVPNREMLKEHLKMNIGDEFTYSPGRAFSDKLRSVVPRNKSKELQEAGNQLESADADK
jgi:hypothetical protein